MNLANLLRREKKLDTRTGQQRAIDERDNFFVKVLLLNVIGWPLVLSTSCNPPKSSSYEAPKNFQISDLQTPQYASQYRVRYGGKDYLINP